MGATENFWVNGRALRMRCTGTTAKGTQCKTSGLYNCPRCDAFLCTWHVLWVEENGKWLGAHCRWCKDETGRPVKLNGRSSGGWLERVERGLYRAVDEIDVSDFQGAQ